MTLCEKIWRKYLHRSAKDDPRLPSLVRALRKVAPTSVVKEVVNTANDRRQWGVLTAAWLGVSERELTRAAAKSMQIEFQERLPRIDPSELVGDRRALLHQMRDLGVVPVFDGPALLKYIAVDPAEVRGFTLYTGKETVVLGCWSDIARTVDEALQEVQREDDARLLQTQHHMQELCLKVLDLLIVEARGHQTHSLEIVSMEGMMRYQFETADGRRGRGSIHKGVTEALLKYLAQSDGSIIHSDRVGEVLVRNLGNRTNFRLTWSRGKEEAGAISSLLPLPAPVRCPQPPGAQPPDAKSHGVSLHFAGTEVRPDVNSCKAQGEPILVVDDNPMFARVLERLLVRDGYAPHFAENGAVALELLSSVQALRPGAIVCDLHMPRMNGKEFVAHIRSDERWNTIPIVMLTSDDDVEVELSLLNLGVDAFVQKTKDPRVLVAHIRRVIKGRIQRVAA